MTRRTLVCLANSIKLGGFCFAGFDPDTGEWVRPIGSGVHGAVTRSEQQLGDRTIAKLLDVVSVPLDRHDPIPGQPENWALGHGAWEFEGRLSDGEAVDLLETLVCDGPIFGAPRKRVSVAAVESGFITSSLAIARPRKLAWRWEGTGKLYAEFEHAGHDQSLKVTDPEFISVFADDEPEVYGREDKDTTYLTVSLPEEWQGAHWKLVAAVIRL